MCERELETEQNGNILTPTLLVITAFLFRSPELLNQSPTRLIPKWLIGGLRAPCAECWLFLPHLVSNWLNFLCTELYNSSTSTFLWSSQIALIQPIHGQGYTLLILDRMYLLFTQVYFLFWQPGRVAGQYTTVMLEYGVHFHDHYSQIHSNPEWKYLLQSHIWVYFIFYLTWNQLGVFKQMTDIKLNMVWFLLRVINLCAYQQWYHLNYRWGDSLPFRRILFVRNYA